MQQAIPRALAAGGLIAALLMALPASAGGIAFYPPVAVGATPLPETSGIAESRLHPGTLWIHDDSGNPAIVYGVNYAGKAQASYNFGSQTDWEDIAVGPGKNSASSIYVGDTGDNGFSRAYVSIYRMAEPTTLTSDPNPMPQSQYEQAKIQYPNGPHDVEALTVDPITGDLYLFSKGATNADVSYVYRAGQSIFDPPAPGTFHIVDQVSTLSILSRITAADISPDGQWLLIRNHGATAYAYRRLPGQTIADALLGTPTGIALAVQLQAEAIGWAADGSGFFTTSEFTGSKIYYHQMATPGDANLDHLVDGADYTLWADSYLQTGKPWGDGDFNGDNIIDGGDYTIWADNYSPVPSSVSAVPEPTSLAHGIAAIAIVGGLIARRWSR